MRSAVNPGRAAWRPRLCFVSYRQLSRMALSIIAEYEDRADIEVVDELFSSALDQALSRERVGIVDAFVSAGANAMILKGSVSSPVATIKVTGYDLLLALLKAKEFSTRVGIVTYKETIGELDAVKALLKIDVTQKAYETPEQARENFRQLAADGHRVIVGSSIVVEMAAQHGLHGILAYSLGSVRQGIEDAIALARVAQLETARTEQLNSVLDNLREAVLAVNEKHRLVALNPAMEEILGRSRHSLIGQDLADVASEFSLTDTLETGRSDRGSIVSVARRTWVADRTPIRELGQVRGAVLALHASSDINAADSRLRSHARDRQTQRTRYTFRDLVGATEPLLRAKETARRFAKTDLTVLISGESGTGKELFAQSIHSASSRADRPFVAVNCSAFPETLLESELFGYEDGAFTGARKGGKSGVFESAHTGTLFLDEIGDMPLPLQTRLLRALQEREVVRLGGATPIPVDVRVIAATHQPLAELVGQRRFRADLYYRINILHLPLPALRERTLDIPLLAQAHLDRCLARFGSRVSAASLLDTLGPRLMNYEWPGNVRELENVCERLSVLCLDAVADEPIPIRELARHCPEIFSSGSSSTVAEGVLPDEPSRIQSALQQCAGNRQRAARMLGMSRATLWRRMQHWKLAGD